MSKQILIVEPSEVVRHFLREIIVSSGFKPAQAVDCRKALKSIYNENNQLAMVFMEWHFVKESGIDLLKEIKEHQSDLPVVVVTTESQKKVVITALQSGAADYIIKPFSVKQIRDKIERFVVK